MDPTIAGALIGAGAGVAGIIGTVIGGRQSTKAASKMLLDQLTEQRAADADRRTWERRLAAYADSLAYVHHQRLVIDHRSRPYRSDAATEERLAKKITDAAPQKSFVEIRSNFRLVASREALNALNELETAWDDLYAAEVIRGSLPPATGQIGATEVASLAVKQARKRISELSERLESLLRDEVDARPAVAIAVPTPRKPLRDRIRPRSWRR